MSPETISAISKAKHDLVSAKARNSGVLAAKEKMKNILFNYCDELVELAVENQNLRREIEALETALEESDHENDELRAKLKAAEGKQKKGNAENAEG